MCNAGPATETARGGVVSAWARRRSNSETTALIARHFLPKAKTRLGRDLTRPRAEKGREALALEFMFVARFASRTENPPQPLPLNARGATGDLLLPLAAWNATSYGLHLMQAFSVSHWVDDVSDSDQKDISRLLLPGPEDLAIGEVAGPFRCIAKTVASLEGSHRGRWRSLVGVHGICGAKCLASAKSRVGKQEKTQPR